MKLKALALILLSTQFCGARENTLTKKHCSPAEDFSAQFGRVRFQGNAPTCFAFVAADMIGYTQKLPPGEQVAAIDVGISGLSVDPKKIRAESKKFPDSDTRRDVREFADAMQEERAKSKGKMPWDRLDGGLIQATIFAYGMRGGLCTEKQLPSEKEGSVQENLNFLETQIRDLQTPDHKIPAPNCFPQEPNSMAELQKLSVKVSEEALRNIETKIQQRCSPRIPLKPIVTESVEIDKRGPKSFTALAIAETLSRKAPVAIGYDSSYFDTGKPGDKVPDHTSIVVGMRWNKEKNQCEFKIRNTWGPGCERYHESIRKDCEGGNIWVSADMISRSVQEATTVISGGK